MVYRIYPITNMCSIIISNICIYDVAMMEGVYVGALRRDVEIGMRISMWFWWFEYLRTLIELATFIFFSSLMCDILCKSSIACSFIWINLLGIAIKGIASLPTCYWHINYWRISNFLSRFLNFSLKTSVEELYSSLKVWGDEFSIMVGMGCVVLEDSP